MIHIATLSAIPVMQVYLFGQAQVGLLLADKASIKVFSKYLNYANIFIFDLIIKLLKNTGINKYVIKLIDGKQPLYGLIYV